jgi:hypothetical protein
MRKRSLEIIQLISNVFMLWLFMEFLVIGIWLYGFTDTILIVVAGLGIILFSFNTLDIFRPFYKTKQCPHCGHSWKEVNN